MRRSLIGNYKTRLQAAILDNAFLPLPSIEFKWGLVCWEFAIAIVWLNIGVRVAFGRKTV